MRFDKKVVFVKKGNESYNPNTGEMESKDLRDERYVSLRSVGVDEKNEILGKIDLKAYSLVLKGRGKDYDYVLIDGANFKVLSKEEFRNKTGYIVGEV